MGTPAKVLAKGDVRRLSARAAKRRYAIRNKVIISLSFKAGLRACEIAGLEWGMILGVSGRVGSSILVADGIAKNGRGRRVPVHPELKSQLIRSIAGSPTPDRPGSQNSACITTRPDSTHRRWDGSCRPIRSGTTIADLSGIDRTYVSSLERQRYAATVDMLERLAGALDVPVSALVEGDGEWSV